MQPAKNSEPKALCRFHGTPQGCRRGTHCSFAHEDPTSSSRDAKTWRRPLSGHQNRQESTRSTPTVDSGFCTWKKQLKRTSDSYHFDLVKLGTFFQDGKNLVYGEASSRHEVLRTLASEDGLAIIDKLIDHADRKDSPSARQLSLRRFKETVCPLAQCLTHPNVLSSFVLEKFRNDVFSFIYGWHGRRLLKLLPAITENLRQAIETGSLSRAESNPYEDSILALFESPLALLFQVIELNSGAHLNLDIPPLIEELAERIRVVLTLQDQPHGCQTLKHLSRIQERLGLGQTIPIFSSPDEGRTTQLPSFQITQDLPGSLSKNGVRHNNDHDDITKIQILPTLEEIRSERLEYLPTTDQTTWHIPGVRGLLDRQFRLLREDTVGQLRDAIHAELERMEHPQRSLERSPLNRRLLRTNGYHAVQVHSIFIDRHHGLCLKASFQQPQILREKAVVDRKEWWQKTKRLQSDALVCIIGGHNDLLFCSVFEPMEASMVASRDQTAEVKEKSDLFTRGDRAFVNLKLCNMGRPEIHTALRAVHTPWRVSLVEFPGVLLPAFRPTLEALQKMSQTPDIPFSDLILQIGTRTATSQHILPPAYATKPGFAFSLNCITDTDSDLRFVPGSTFDVPSLVSASSFDLAQSQAIIDALDRSLAIIQGPPGTGKSYTGIALIRILLACQKKVHMGPILCVCYTNHALDQLLEHLVDHKVKQIIRIGSRSKSERLAALNLNEVVQKMSQTKVESTEFYKLRGSLTEKEKEIKELLDNHLSPETWKSIAEHLEATRPHIYEAFFNAQEDDGFTKVAKNPNRRLTDWIHCGPNDLTKAESATIEELEKRPMNSLTRKDRQILYDHWVKESRRLRRQNLIRRIDAYNANRTTYNDIRQEVKLRCLQDAHVIGITTSGLARNLELLRRVRSKVLICEEAGEVLEAHMLTALLPSVQHAILIGDHQQLRPQIQRYDLSSEHPQGARFSLDVSLYERLVQPQIADIPALPFSTLATQRRMHPSISRLIRHTLYPALQDGPNVSDYPPVVGMRNRLTWLDHSKWEDGSEQQDLASTSHSNEYEVGMATALASHLIRQGTYKPNDIAVITPYLGQLHRLRRILGTMYEIFLNDLDVEALEEAGLESGNGRSATDSKSQQTSKSTALKALKVATIDNFQGEEAKIVIISLVRSNLQHNCGFLRTSNRINVLLSRAQHGMYIIGNSQTARSAPMWQDVIQMLREDDLVQPELDLQCPRHPESPLKVRCLDDFQRLSPEGGCDQKCVDRLDCGHACINRCHSETLHGAVKCLVPCQRSRTTCQHACPRKCGDPCPEKCVFNVYDPNRILPCGHLQPDLPCWQSQDLSTYVCRKEVHRTVPGCRHELDLSCFVDFTSDDFKCTAACGTALTCSHTCQRTCMDCRTRSNGVIQTEDHKTCTHVCERPYTTCRHHCPELCHGDQPCPLCDSPCDVSCTHSKCSKKCNEPCNPCAEEHCASQCPHSRCLMPCAAPCDWIPCSKRCPNLLDCGHRCPTLCGESCPSQTFCQTCCGEAVKAQVVDYLEMKTYGEINLDDEPCIFPGCGHILTVSSMDGHMGMSDHYEHDLEGSITSVKDAAPFSIQDLKTCPTCRGSLRNMSRYGRIVRRTLLDESTKKFILWSNRNMISLNERFFELQGHLVNTYEHVKIDARSSPIGLKFSAAQKRRSLRQAAKELLIFGRYKEIFKFRDEIEKFTQDVGEREQPYSRVWDLCESARRQRQVITTFSVEDGVLQTKCREDAVVLSLRCDLTIVSDLVTLVRDKVSKSKIKKLEFDLSGIRDESQKLLQDATRSRRPGHMVESHLFIARCAALERVYADEAAALQLHEEATDHLNSARQTCTQHPGSTPGMMEELEAIEKSLRDTFYSVVTSAERQAILRAMSKDFLGTGHWYYCRNGHPFTVGECGGPMEQTRCPECGEPVGGRDHHAAEGVRRAEDIDVELGNLAL